jgi:hypothetical protein
VQNQSTILNPNHFPQENSWHDSYAQPVTIEVVSLEKIKGCKVRRSTRPTPQPFAFNARNPNQDKTLDVTHLL